MTRRMVSVGMAMLLLGMAVVIDAGEGAGAAAAPIGTGVLTCSVGGSVGFDPPLTYNGEPAGRGQHELASVQIQLANCSGSNGNSPQPNPTSATQKGNGLVRLKPTKVEFMGHIMNALGACGLSDFNPTGTFHDSEMWSGTLVAKTKLGLHLSTNGGTFSGASSGSYAGNHTNGTLDLTPASTSEYNSVCNDEDGNGSIPFLDFEQSTSSITIGE